MCLSHLYHLTVLICDSFISVKKLPSACFTLINEPSGEKLTAETVPVIFAPLLVIISTCFPIIPKDYNVALIETRLLILSFVSLACSKFVN